MRNNERAFSRAQSAWDNASPEEDGPTECPECNGRGSTDCVDCPNCSGCGWFDADGEPVRLTQGDRA